MKNFLFKEVILFPIVVKLERGLSSDSPHWFARRQKMTHRAYCFSRGTVSHNSIYTFEIVYRLGSPCLENGWQFYSVSRKNYQKPNGIMPLGHILQRQRHYRLHLRLVATLPSNQSRTPYYTKIDPGSPPSTTLAATCTSHQMLFGLQSLGNPVAFLVPM